MLLVHPGFPKKGKRKMFIVGTGKKAEKHKSGDYGYYDDYWGFESHFFTIPREETTTTKSIQMTTASGNKIFLPNKIGEENMTIKMVKIKQAITKMITKEKDITERNTTKHAITEKVTKEKSITEILTTEKSITERITTQKAITDMITTLKPIIEMVTATKATTKKTTTENVEEVASKKIRIIINILYRLQNRITTL